MPCGSCGGAGHNRRTCSSGSIGFSSYYDYYVSVPDPPEIRKPKASPSSVSVNDTFGLPSGSSGSSRTIHCGSCGVAGHNRTTCPASSNLGIDIPAEKLAPPKLASASKASPSMEKLGEEAKSSGRGSTVNCGACGIAGHNRRTCPQSKETRKEAKEAELHTPAPTNNCGSCGLPGHNRRSCSDASKKEKPESVPSNDKVSTGKKKDRGVGSGEKAGSGSKAELDKEKAEKDSVLSKDACLEEKGAADKKCSICREGGHNKRSCSQKLRESHWLTPEALERFNRGPTDKDEPGYVYIYKKIISDSAKPNEGENCFKIGQSKHLPERRMRHLASKNKEEYQLVWSGETPHRYLTEKVIHKQLEKYHAPKEEGEGKTEWYNAPRDFLIENSKKVIKEVKMAQDNGNVEKPKSSTN